MLVLSRKANQSIMIGSDIRILVVGVDRDQVKIGIEAPRHVPVHRFEIFAEIHRGDGSVKSPSKQEPVGEGAAGADIPGDADNGFGVRARGFHAAPPAGLRPGAGQRPGRIE